MIDFDEDRAGWELMIANPRVTPITTDLDYPASINGSVTHRARSFFRLFLSSPYPSSLFLFPLIDLAFVHNRFHARPNFVTLPGGEHCGSDLLYARNKQGPQLLDSVGRCFCPWNRYIPPARRSSPMRFMAYGRVLLTRFEWMHGGFCTGTCYVSKSIVSVVLLEIWLYLSSMDSRSCL